MQAQEDKQKAREWFDRESTGFITVVGTAVHKCRMIGDSVFTRCGLDGGDATGNKSVKFVKGPCTCRRCNN